MLIHLRPRCFSPFENVALVDLRIRELGLHLIGGRELTTRRPYPNKRYAVACAKVGRKAVDGLFMETSAAVSSFTAIIRWAIEAEFVATHIVEYEILDSRFDAVSENMTAWHRTSQWEDRRPAPQATRNAGEPRMEIVGKDGAVEKDGVSTQKDPVSGYIIWRRERLSMPTIQKERMVNTSSEDRWPSMATAIPARPPV